MKNKIVLIMFFLVFQGIEGLDYKKIFSIESIQKKIFSFKNAIINWYGQNKRPIFLTGATALLLGGGLYAMYRDSNKKEIKKTKPKNNKIPLNAEDEQKIKIYLSQSDIDFILKNNINNNNVGRLIDEDNQYPDSILIARMNKYFMPIEFVGFKIEYKDPLERNISNMNEKFSQEEKDNFKEIVLGMAAISILLEMFYDEGKLESKNISILELFSTIIKSIENKITMLVKKDTSESILINALKTNYLYFPMNLKNNILIEGQSLDDIRKNFPINSTNQAIKFPKNDEEMIAMSSLSFLNKFKKNPDLSENPDLSKIFKDMEAKEIPWGCSQYIQKIQSMLDKEDINIISLCAGLKDSLSSLIQSIKFIDDTAALR